jgi:dUTP pyrophosphatase
MIKTLKHIAAKVVYAAFVFASKLKSWSMDVLNRPLTFSVEVIFDDDLYEPIYKTAGASGADVKAAHDIVVKAHTSAVVDTGVAINLPQGTEAQLRARSGNAFKYDVTLSNGIGTIDNDFQDTIKAKIYNHGNEDFVINRGDRIAQLVFIEYKKAIFKQVSAFSSTTKRGKSGLGSTGKR